MRFHAVGLVIIFAMFIIGIALPLLGIGLAIISTRVG